jgi:hypothetical protein
MKKLSAPSILVSLLFAGLVAAQPSDGLVAYWSLNDGTATDNSGNGHNGIIHGAPQLVSGVNGNALSFDGVDDWIEGSTGSSDFNVNNLTACCWLRPSITSGEHGVIGKWWEDGNMRQYLVFIYDNSIWAYGSPNGGGTGWQRTGCPISANNWSFVCEVVESTHVSLWVDGQMRGEFDMSGSLAQFNSSLWFGGYPFAGRYLQGALDEVRFYNRALSPSELQELHTGGLPGIAILHPIGGEHLPVGILATLRWSAPFQVENVAISLNRSFPLGSWESIVFSAPNTGSYSWLVTGPVTSTARVRVLDSNYPTNGDTSDTDFAIVLSPVAPGPDTLWTMTYGGNMNEVAYAIRQTSDGGYILCGLQQMMPGSGMESDWLLMRLSDTSDVNWVRTYGGPVYDQACDVVQTADGGFAITGSFWRGTPTSMIGFIKTSSTGVEEWRRYYTDGDQCHSILQTPGGGYVIGGRTNNWTGVFDYYLACADQDGNNHVYHTFGGSGDDQASDVIQTQDGGYLLVGNSSSTGSGDYDGWIVKTDCSGNLIWSHTVGGSGDEELAEARQTYDGGYIIAGGTSSFGNGRQIYLVKTDSLGNEQWTKSYGGVGDEMAAAVVITPDSGYALAGETSSYGAGGEDFWLLRTDKNGDSLWSRTFGGQENNVCSSMDITEDWGYILVGTTQYSNGSNDILVVRTTPDARIWAVSPNGNESVTIGETCTIAWSFYNILGSVNIELNRNYPNASWEVISANAANTGSFSWLVTGPVTTTARLRVVSVANPSFGDASDADFVIVDQQLPDAPDNVIIITDSIGVVLRWNSVQGASIQFRVFSDSATSGSFNSLIGTTTDTSYVDSNSVSSHQRRFYIVKTLRP